MKEKNYAVLALVTGLTPGQAANLSCEITKLKIKVAPNARGTAVTGPTNAISELTQKKRYEITGKEQ